MQEMISQKVRTLSPEIDPLRMGMGQTEADLEKPQVMVESTFGDSHPGSAHLLCLVEAAAAGVRSAGGNPARYFATDICDGMAHQLLACFEGDHCGCHRDPRYGHAF